MLEHQRALATLRERDRLARELHDSLGQVLGFAKMQAQAARELLARQRGAQADAHLAQLVSVAQDAHADVREYILGARADGARRARLPAGPRGLPPALPGDLRHRHRARASPALAGRALGPMAGTQLLRILQEALTNVRKHARARSVRIGLAVSDGQSRRPSRTTATASTRRGSGRPRRAPSACASCASGREEVGGTVRSTPRRAGAPAW